VYPTTGSALARSAYYKQEQGQIIFRQNAYVYLRDIHLPGKYGIEFTKLHEHKAGFAVQGI